MKYLYNWLNDTDIESSVQEEAIKELGLPQERELKAADDEYYDKNDNLYWYMKDLQTLETVTEGNIPRVYGSDSYSDGVWEREIMQSSDSVLDVFLIVPSKECLMETLVTFKIRDYTIQLPMIEILYLNRKFRKRKVEVQDFDQGYLVPLYFLEFLPMKRLDVINCIYSIARVKVENERWDKEIMKQIKLKVRYSYVGDGRREMSNAYYKCWAGLANSRLAHIDSKVSLKFENINMSMPLQIVVWILDQTVRPNIVSADFEIEYNGDYFSKELAVEKEVTFDGFRGLVIPINRVSFTEVDRRLERMAKGKRFKMRPENGIPFLENDIPYPKVKMGDEFKPKEEQEWIYPDDKLYFHTHLLFDQPCPNSLMSVTVLGLGYFVNNNGCYLSKIPYDENLVDTNHRHNGSQSHYFYPNKN